EEAFVAFAPYGAVILGSGGLNMSFVRPTAIALLLAGLAVFAAPEAEAKNAIIFVADGLRAGSVTPEAMPTMAALAARGVRFDNSHSLFPTVTTANASAIATGHYLGDTGDFANTLYFGFPIQAAKGAPGSFLESDAVLKELNAHYDGNYLNETSFLA